MACRNPPILRIQGTWHHLAHSVAMSCKRTTLTFSWDQELPSEGQTECPCSHNKSHTNGQKKDPAVIRSFLETMMLFVSSCEEWVGDWKPCWCKSTGQGDGESLDQYTLFLYHTRTCSEHHCSLRFQKDKDMGWFNVTPVKGQRSQWSADSVNQAIATRSTL